MPGYANPQNLNRYSYVTNNPLRYTDPSGHMRVQDGPQHDRFKPWVAEAYRPRPHRSGNSGIGDGPTIGPTVQQPSEPSNSNDPAPEFNLWKDTYDGGQWIDAGVTWTINYGRPVYKHVKGVIPGSFPVEFGLGALTSALNDLNNPNLSLGQRTGRALVVGLEDGVTDLASTALAGIAAPVGAQIGGVAGALVGGLLTAEVGGAGGIPGLATGEALGGGVTFVAVSYGTTRLLDEKVWAPANQSFLPFLFP